MKKFIACLFLSGVVNVLFVASLFAQDAAPAAATAAPVVDAVAATPAAPSMSFEKMYHAVQSGEWLWLAAFLLVGVVFVARKYGAKTVPWLATDRGGVVLVLATAFAGGLGNALLAGDKLSLDLLKSMAEVAVTAIGGYAGVRRMLWPKDKKSEAAPESKPEGQ